MSTERLKVLEMLNAGTITIEQANQLIDALGEKTLAEGSVAEGQTIRIDHAPATIGHGGLTFEQIIELAKYHVRPELVREVREAGLDLSFEQIIELGKYHVRPELIQEVREAGLDLTFEQIIELGKYHVRPEIVQHLRESGLEFSFEQIVELGKYHVDPEFVAQLRKASAVTA
ncbi:MAG: hypothetical protein H7Y32_05785 [Chloroflexales bacterium]|nr:hypothetical protein [Chloroflexales bacterium]